MSVPQPPSDKRAPKQRKPKDPHPNDRFTQWKKDEFINEVRKRAKAADIKVNVPELRALVTITLDVLKDAALNGIIINFYGFMRWGAHTHRACTFTRLGQKIEKKAYTCPHVRFSTTYRARVKEAHQDAQS